MNESADILARARNRDEDAFRELVSPHERALFRHCYRMLGSGADAEEAVQDTLERAWRRLSSYNATGPFGGWLYRIATNVSIDRLRSRKNRSNPLHTGPPVGEGGTLSTPDLSLEWTEPIADVALGVADDPAALIVRREHISLAFVAALQLLAPRPRAVLLLHDVLGFNQADIAATLDVTPSSVNSLLYRARQRMKAEPIAAADIATPDDPAFQDLLARYVRAWEVADIDQLVGLLVDDVSISMPPLSDWFQGLGDVTRFIESAIFGAVDHAGIPLRRVWVNRQPGLVVYDPGDDDHVEPTGLQVLDVTATPSGPKIRHITSYRGAEIVRAAGL